MHSLLGNNPFKPRPAQATPSWASKVVRAARPFLRDQSGKTRLTAQDSQRRRTVCSDAARNSRRGQYMLRSAVQLAEPQLAVPDSISSRPFAADTSRPCLGLVGSARAARDVYQKLQGIVNACSENGVAAIVQQQLQSTLDQQQLLVTWLESQVQQAAPSSTSSKAVASSYTADAATSRASEESSITAIDCTAARSAPNAARSANSSPTNSTCKPDSFVTHPEISRVKSLAEGFLGPLDSPINSVEDPVQAPKAIWAGVAATRGKKKAMEDCHAVHYLHPQLGVQDVAECSDASSSTFLAGVYDGHGGRHTAAYAAAQLPLLLQQELLNSSKQGAVSEQQLFSGVFDELDRSWATFGQFTKSGSTAVTAKINKKNLVTANAGDSVAVLARGGSSRRLTQSHKLSHPAELERISAVGGSTVRDRAGNLRLMQSPLRLQPYVAPMTLAVTRGFGDFGFKGVGGDLVIPTPHVNELELSVDDELLLLVSDGITDVMNDDAMMEVAVNAISKARNDTNEGSQLSSAAAAAVKDAALVAGAWDNLTVVAILMDWNKM